MGPTYRAFRAGILRDPLILALTLNILLVLFLSDALILERSGGGHARGNGSDGSPRNHCDDSRRNVLSQVSGLAGVEFSSCDYRDLIIPAKSIVCV